MTISKKTGFTGRDRGTKVFKQMIVNGVVIPSQLIFTITQGASNICNVKVGVADADGNLIARVHTLDLLLSDAATGVGLTGTTASGTVQAKSASGTDLGALTSKKALRVQTLATGEYTLEITDSAKTHFYVAGVIPGFGKLQVSRQLLTADYGT